MSNSLTLDALLKKLSNDTKEENRDLDEKLCHQLNKKRRINLTVMQQV